MFQSSAKAREGARFDWGSSGRRFKSCQPDRETPVRPVYLADLVLESARANPLIPASSQRAGAESDASSICWPDQRRSQRSSPAQSPRLSLTSGNAVCSIPVCNAQHIALAAGTGLIMRWSRVRAGLGFEAVTSSQAFRCSLASMFVTNWRTADQRPLGHARSASG